MACSPQDSSVHEISPTRVLGELPFPPPGESSWPRDWTCLLHRLHCRQILYCWATRVQRYKCRDSWPSISRASTFLDSTNFGSTKNTIQSWLKPAGMESQSWDLSIHWFWCLGQVLEPVPSSRPARMNTKEQLYINAHFRSIKGSNLKNFSQGKLKIIVVYTVG